MHSNDPYRYNLGGDQVSSMLCQYKAYILVARNSIQGSFWLLGNHFSLETEAFYHILGEIITFHHQFFMGGSTKYQLSYGCTKSTC